VFAHLKKIGQTQVKDGVGRDSEAVERICNEQRQRYTISSQDARNGELWVAFDRYIIEVLYVTALLKDRHAQRQK
jgi:hypothetical protein